MLVLTLFIFICEGWDSGVSKECIGGCDCLEGLGAWGMVPWETWKVQALLVYSMLTPQLCELLWLTGV